MKNKLRKYFPLLLLTIYLIEFLILAVHPADRVIWITENSIGLLIAAAMVFLYWKKIRFSNPACFLITVYLCFHTVGGHYTFAEVPFDAVTEFFGFQRNNFDRVCHFMVGFFAFPAMEYFESRKLIRGRGLNAILMIFAVFGIAAMFELVEWIYAELANPSAGAAFLGSQGDIWDAQKDMLCDGSGAVFSTVLYALFYRGKTLNESDLNR
jgi:putative membrane protein